MPWFNDFLQSRGIVGDPPPKRPKRAAADGTYVAPPQLPELPKIGPLQPQNMAAGGGIDQSRDAYQPLPVEDQGVLGSGEGQGVFDVLPGVGSLRGVKAGAEMAEKSLPLGLLMGGLSMLPEGGELARGAGKLIGKELPYLGKPLAAIRVHVPGEAEPRLFTGHIHPMARNDAEDQLGDLLDENFEPRFQIDEGFVVGPDQQWLSRKEAGAYAKKHKLMGGNVKANESFKRNGQLKAEALKQDDGYGSAVADSVGMRGLGNELGKRFGPGEFANKEALQAEFEKQLGRPLKKTETVNAVTHPETGEPAFVLHDQHEGALWETLKPASELEKRDGGLLADSLAAAPERVLGAATEAAEKIVAAAIRSHDGRVFQGINHGEAHEALEAAGAGPWNDEGFVTNTGRFVDRKEALKVATRAKQAAPEHGDTELLAEDVPGSLLDAPSGELEEPKRNNPLADSLAVGGARGLAGLLGKDHNPHVLDVVRKMVRNEPMPRISAVDPEKASHMAKVYESLPKHDPAAASAYDALNREVDQQFKAITDAGYKIEFVDKDPYANSAEMMKDVRDNKRLKVFKTQGESFHPYMTPEQNDRFRAVHDWIAHAGPGNQFGPVGEENAYRMHAATLSPEAQRALATETRGQNSWVNYGPNGHLPVKERPFAEQKAALWPQDLLGDYDGMQLKGQEPEKIAGPAYKVGEDILRPEPGDQMHVDVWERNYPKDKDFLEHNRLRQAGVLQQGFVTTSGRFVDRGEAAQIAKAQRQAEPEGPGLFGEDLKRGAADDPERNNPLADSLFTAAPKIIIPKGDQSTPVGAAAKLMDTPEEVQARVAAARAKLAEPVEPWVPTPRGLLDRSLIVPDDASSAGPVVLPHPRTVAKTDKKALGHLVGLDTPDNIDLVQRQIQRGEKLGGPTFYPSFRAIDDVIAHHGGDPVLFRNATSAGSARNSIHNEQTVGTVIQYALKRGIIDLDAIAAAQAKGPKAVEALGARVRNLIARDFPDAPGIPMMPSHLLNFLKLRRGLDPEGSFKIPTYDYQKGGGLFGSVLDTHEATGETLASPFHRYFSGKGGFDAEEYGPVEGLFGDIAGGMGLTSRNGQASRWTGGGGLTGLKSAMGDAAQHLEDNVFWNASTRKNVTDAKKLLKQIAQGDNILYPWFKKGRLPIY